MFASLFRDQLLVWGGPGRGWVARALVRLARLGWWAATGQFWARWRAEKLGLARLEIPVVAAPLARLIRIPVVDRPRVSIVIPCHGQVDFTLRCLAAIARHPPADGCEVIVIDDASAEADAAVMREIPGIRLLRNRENLGFLHSVNRGAAVARGEYVLLLNNDTQPLAGAIDALAETLDRCPRAGLVGAMLLFPDGSLQEAGGLVWRDGSAWNFGRGDNPARCQYAYQREVDYCSAAALMARRGLWERLGGFDPAFVPAYCEDSDFSFRARRAGFACLYQPRARVIHWEGVSHGTDLTRGIKAHQTRNQALLARRWRAELASHAAPGAPVLRALARGGKTVLVIDHQTPEPDRDAGSRTLSDILTVLQEVGARVIFCPWDGDPRGAYGAALRERGVHVLTPPDLHGWMRAHGDGIDAVLLSRPHVARQALPMVRRFTRARVGYYGHDLHALRLRRLGRLGLVKRGEVRAMARLERRVWRAADVVLMPSAAEVRAVRRLAPGVAADLLAPYALGPAPVPRAPSVAPVLLFVGNFAHPPNRDAAAWLVHDIFPLVRQAVPRATLYLVGARPGLDIQALEGGGIRLHADVSAADLAAHLAMARVAIIPLRAGAGVKLKTVEALHAGLPVVTTPTGAQGLPGIAGVVDVADTAEALAAAAIRLLVDDELWRARHAAQRDYVRFRFTAEAQRAVLCAALGLVPV